MDTSTRTLAEIALAAGNMNQAHVALFSRLSTSTISRLWNDPDWLSHTPGATVVKLIAAVPGVLEYVAADDPPGGRVACPVPRTAD